MCPFSYCSQCILIVLTLLLVCGRAFAQWNFQFSESEVVYMDETREIEFSLTGPDSIGEEYIQIRSEDTNVVEVDKQYYLNSSYYNREFNSTFNATGVFLGYTNILLRVMRDKETVFFEEMPVKVVRRQRPIDSAFTISVATLVGIIFINFGCALDWDLLMKSLKRPYGPIIGFLSQFLVMPLLSFALAKILFPDNVAIQLGMFFTGVSPGGGASNIWTYILDGNLNLSITMSSISTFAAFFMMPLWIFTLGRVIFEQGNLGVPYGSIAEYAFVLVVPLLIGYLIKRYLPKVSDFLIRILKVFSLFLILFIVIFASVTNLYLFKLFSWQIVVGGLGLPWLGYVFGSFIAFICKQPPKDILAIGIETGIQNTGIAIFLLRLALPQPEADLTTVVPVAVAVMTPWPLLLMFIYKKIRQRCQAKYVEHDKLDSFDISNPSEVAEPKERF